MWLQITNFRMDLRGCQIWCHLPCSDTSAMSIWFEYHITGSCIIVYKGEHECTHGWPGSIPMDLQPFKIQTQIWASNRVLTQIHRSSTHKNTSTCYLIKKSDTSLVQTGTLTFMTGCFRPLSYINLNWLNTQNIKPVYAQSCRKLKHILYKGWYRHSI
jgi:hypothetical protein